MTSNYELGERVRWKIQRYRGRYDEGFGIVVGKSKTRPDLHVIVQDPNETPHSWFYRYSIEQDHYDVLREYFHTEAETDFEWDEDTDEEVPVNYTYEVLDDPYKGYMFYAKDLAPMYENKDYTPDQNGDSEEDI